MKIYKLSYLDLNGEYKGVVIAKNDTHAKELFVNYFGEDDFKKPVIYSDSVTVIEIGTAKSKQYGIVICK